MAMEDSAPSSAVVDAANVRSEDTIVANFMAASNGGAFSIRAFVSRERKKDPRKTWPFSAELLDRYLREGKSLPHLDLPPPSTLSSIETSSAGEVSSDQLPGIVAGTVGDAGIELQVEIEPPHPQEREEQARDDHDQEFREEHFAQDHKDEQALEALQQLKLRNSGISSQDRQGQVQDREEHTVVVHPAAENVLGKTNMVDRAAAAAVQVLDQLLQVHHEAAAPAAAPPMTMGDVVNVIVNDGAEPDSQLKICPVCSSFTSHSTTALNAHMDGCLSKPGADRSRLRKPSSGGGGGGGSGGKVQKMRSITDIIAADPTPVSPKSDSVVKPRERRAPNNVVLLAEKTSEKSGGGVGLGQSGMVSPASEQRNLRSRSRGSGSFASPKFETERSTRRLRREMSNHKNTTTPVEWSDRKKRPCNSVEVTSCSWSSISSGTHSKTQEIQVDKMSTAEGDKPSESHGSADCFEQRAMEVDVDLSSSKDKELERSSTTTNADGNNHDGNQVTTAPQPQVQLSIVEVTTTTATTTKSTVDANPQSVANTSNKPSSDEHPPSSSETTVAVPIATKIPVTTKNVVQQQLRKPVIPNFSSVISSLRTSNVVDSPTGFQHSAALSWKGAVALATLGAPLKEASSLLVPSGVLHTTAAASKCDVLVMQATGTPRTTTAMTTTQSTSEVPTTMIMTTTTQALPSLGARVHHHQHYQVGSGSRFSQGVTVAQPAKAHWMVPPPAVIDVDQDSPTQASSPDGTVLRLLGHNVMVEASTTTTTRVVPQQHKDAAAAAVGNKAPYAGQVATCCCGAGPEHVHGTSGKGGLPGIPTTWRLVQNAMVPVPNVNFQAAPTTTIHKSSPGTLQIGTGYATSAVVEPDATTARTVKLPGDLPHWLLPIKKQKEAESNVIVIDDDEPEEDKEKVVLHGTPASRPSPSNADVQFTGERLVQPLSFHYGAPSSTSSSRKREAPVGDWGCGVVDKSTKLTTVDSPSRLVTLVPTWTMMIPNNAATQAAPSSKRGSTAQTYKARIAMMKSCYVNEAGQVVSMVSPAAAAAPSMVQPIYQMQPAGTTGATTVRQFMHGSERQQLHLQQQPMNVIELENGELLLVNADAMDQQNMLARPPQMHQQIHQQPAMDHFSYGHQQYYHHHGGHGGRSGTTSFRDGLGRNFIICNGGNEVAPGGDHHQRRVATGEQFLVTPILSDHHHHGAGAAAGGVSFKSGSGAVVSSQQQQQRIPTFAAAAAAGAATLKS